MSAASRKAASLQADLERLEAIVRALEANDLDLDRALELFEEGVGRLRDARERLGTAELRLRQLREAADGSIRADDLEG
ncbi:MAG: exodeoxyribonuclease VII small subunit [Gemmatimonadetes bacterium GWC2_71_9]|nr:MAG: exodeoxyribonuclease VII small subunit [Gemmatimonadetes bacterium GWC2_71_9]